MTIKYYFFSLLLISLIACDKDDDMSDLPVVLADGIDSYSEGEFFDGYTFFAPNAQKTTYLINMQGFVVNSWESDYQTGRSAYLLENGDMIRSAQLRDVEPIDRFDAGGFGGRFERFNWAGDLIWEMNYKTAEYGAHHDFEVLPNGNILILAWEYKTEQEALDAGRNPSTMSEASLWPEKIVEIQPTGNEGGLVVWEWHVWDHLIQDFDDTKNNFGVVSEHPEKINLNYTKPIAGDKADWQHANGIDYNSELDQIILTVNFFDEFWLIDHSTTTAEAATNTGGNAGKGGNLLYRWGNPATYNNNTTKQLFACHHAHWIDTNLPGGGNILVFDNGREGELQEFSEVVELMPTVNGQYSFDENIGYLPQNPIWDYQNPEINSDIISGAQRLPNGNTLICNGRLGKYFEITPTDRVVWSYQYEPTELVASTFRALRYAKDYQGLANRDLTIKGEAN